MWPNMSIREDFFEGHRKETVSFIQNVDLSLISARNPDLVQVVKKVNKWW